MYFKNNFQWLICKDFKLYHESVLLLNSIFLWGKALEISSHLQMFELCIACLGYTKAKCVLWEVRRASSVVASPNKSL